MVLKHLIALFGLFHLGACPQMGPTQEVVRYEGAAMEVLGSRPFPQWFLDAKLGIFVHWGVYSVPAYSGAEEYAEWFLRGLQQGDSLRTRFMRERFGKSFQ